MTFPLQRIKSDWLPGSFLLISCPLFKWTFFSSWKILWNKWELLKGLLRHSLLCSGPNTVFWWGWLTYCFDFMLDAHSCIVPHSSSWDVTEQISIKCPIVTSIKIDMFKKCGESFTTHQLMSVLLFSMTVHWRRKVVAGLTTVSFIFPLTFAATLFTISECFHQPHPAWTPFFTCLPHSGISKDNWCKGQRGTTKQTI